MDGAALLAGARSDWPVTQTQEQATSARNRWRGFLRLPILAGENAQGAIGAGVCSVFAGAEERHDASDTDRARSIRIGLGRARGGGPSGCRGACVPGANHADAADSQSCLAPTGGLAAGGVRSGCILLGDCRTLWSDRVSSGTAHARILYPRFLGRHSQSPSATGAGTQLDPDRYRHRVRPGWRVRGEPPVVELALRRATLRHAVGFRYGHSAGKRGDAGQFSPGAESGQNRSGDCFEKRLKKGDRLLFLGNQPLKSPKFLGRKRLSVPFFSGALRARIIRLHRFVAGGLPGRQDATISRPTMMVEALKEAEWPQFDLRSTENRKPWTLFRGCPCSGCCAIR